MATATEQRDEIKRRLLWTRGEPEDTEFFAEHCLTIVDKSGRRVPFIYNEAQRRLDRKLEAQKAAGLAQMSIILKSRQVGISTLFQAKSIKRCTQRADHQAIVVAHDRETGRKLYKIGERMYANLPDDRGLRLKPAIGAHRRGTRLEFGAAAADAWQHPGDGLNSSYVVDTAGEFQGGRGGTYPTVHGSEVAFWAQILEKLAALLGGVPDDPETLVGLESTPNGENEFKDLWDDAVNGVSNFIAFFWGWWQQAEYTLPFANEAEREKFAAEVGTGAYGEDEPALLSPGPIDHTLDEPAHIPLTLEQLHWRRRTIANKLGGDLARFRREFASSPEEAFLASGRQVFDPQLVRGVLIANELTDPRVPTAANPGPRRGAFVAQSTFTREGRNGPVEVAQSPLWTPRAAMADGTPARWIHWLKPGEAGDFKPSGEHILGCDVSGGQMEETDEPAYHAIEIINHRTLEQVAEYSSRVDPDLLAVELYLAALFFAPGHDPMNGPWIGVEITGGWGLPVARKLWLDFGYPFVYMRTRHEGRNEKQMDRLGWDTNRQTKPIIEANAKALLREERTGIKSRALALEMQSYVRDDKGRTSPSRGRYSDRLIAWEVAQQIAREKPLREEVEDDVAPGWARQPMDPVTGY